MAAGHTHAHNSQTGSRNEETSKDRVKWRERRQSREDATPHTNETEDNLPAIERGFEIFADNNSTIHWFYRETRHNWSFSEPNSIRLIFIHTHTHATTIHFHPLCNVVDQSSLRSGQRVSQSWIILSLCSYDVDPIRPLCDKSPVTSLNLFSLELDCLLSQSSFTDFWVAVGLSLHSSGRTRGFSSDEGHMKLRESRAKKQKWEGGGVTVNWMSQGESGQFASAVRTE